STAYATDRVCGPPPARKSAPQPRESPAFRRGEEVNRCPRCHPVAVAENTITEPTETPTTVPGHHADEDKPASGTGEIWDLPAPPEHERGRDAATDAARPQPRLSQTSGPNWRRSDGKRPAEY